MATAEAFCVSFGCHSANSIEGGARHAGCCASVCHGRCNVGCDDSCRRHSSTQRTIHRPTLSIETQLADSSIVSLFTSGPWFVVSNTNLWGVDPGDPSHFMSVTIFLVPFEGLSGFI